MADNRDANAAMSFVGRWAGPFAGATAALGAVVGFVTLGGGGQQVLVPSAAVVQPAASAVDDDHADSSSPSSPFTVVYPKRTVDVVEVPDAGDEASSSDTGESGATTPVQSPPPTPSAIDDGGDQAPRPAGVDATPTRGEGESDDTRVSRTASPTPRPSSTPTASRTWTNDDEGDGGHTPDS